MRAWILGAALAMALPGARADTDYAALLDEAVAAVHWQFHEDWAFTETTLKDDKLWVARYDPRVEEHNGWSLVSVDGREPTGRERRGFLHDKGEQEGGSNAGNNRVVRLVKRDSLELIEETDSHWLLSFEPEEDESFVTELTATLRIAKEGRYVESLDLRNEGDLKPGFGTTLSSFLIKLTFGPAVAGAPVVPKDIKVRVAGRALFFIGIEETEVIEYSDFEFAGD